MKANDNTVITFGKYEGTKLANIPASYLLWLYEKVSSLDRSIKAYIEDNMDLLKHEIEKEKNETRRTITNIR